MFKKKRYISLINTKWEPIKQNLKVDAIPKRDEFIYIEELGKYFLVINLVHKLNQRHHIFVVVSEFDNSIKKSIW